LSFAGGETSKTIRVQVNGDTTVESNETRCPSVQRPAQRRRRHAAGTIQRRHRAPADARDRRCGLCRNSAASPGSGTFTVTLSAAYDVPVTVRFATADGTATGASNDYAAASGTLTFAPGETTKTITIAVKGDRKKEADETFFVNLAGATNALIEDGQGIGTILDDDR
jgi:hypothetical protein